MGEEAQLLKHLDCEAELLQGTSGLVSVGVAALGVVRRCVLRSTGEFRILARAHLRLAEVSRLALTGLSEDCHALDRLAKVVLAFTRADALRSTERSVGGTRRRCTVAQT